MLHTDIYPVGIMDIVKHCTYVGMAGDVFALLQHKTHLYLANIVNLRY
jgi:DNA mismatch repair protein MLH1